MRHGPAGRRMRNRGGSGGGNNNRRGGGGGGHNRNQVFDSNGPDVRIRGTANQIQEKYAALAKDSAASGDLILAESYLQHAEHYQRIINTWLEQGNGYQHNNADDQESEDLGMQGRYEPRHMRTPQHPGQGPQPNIPVEQPVAPVQHHEQRQTQMVDA